MDLHKRDSGSEGQGFESLRDHERLKGVMKRKACFRLFRAPFKIL